MNNLEEKGVICIKYVDGLYVFPNNIDETSFSNNEKNHNDISLLNGYRYIDLSQCCSVDEITAVLLKTTMEIFLFYCTRSTWVLVKEICQKFTLLIDKVKLIWIVEGIEQACKLNLDSFSIGVYPSLSYFHQNYEKLNNISSFDEKELISFLPDDGINTHNKMYETAMKNGFCLMLTGKYPNSFSFTKAKHVYVPNPDILDAAFLPEFMDINSAIFIPYEKYDIMKYKEWKTKYYNHIHFIDNENLFLDGTIQSIPWKKMSYSDFYAQDFCTDIRDSTPYVEMSTERDYDCFIEDIESFMKTGTVRDYNFFLLNECRWANRCSLLYQMRFLLDKDYNVSPCMNTKNHIYHVKEPEYNKFDIREKLIEQTQIKRECRKCPAAERCTKCSFLSEGLSSERFCDLVINYPVIPEFINIKNDLLILHYYSSFAKKIDLRTLRFSNYSHSLILPSNMHARKAIDQNMYLFQMGEKNFCYNPLNGHIISVGNNLALIIEAIQKGFEYNEIRLSYNEVWNNEPSEKNFQLAWDTVQTLILSQ